MSLADTGDPPPQQSSSTSNSPLIRNQLFGISATLRCSAETSTSSRTSRRRHLLTWNPAALRRTELRWLLPARQSLSPGQQLPQAEAEFRYLLVHPQIEARPTHSHVRALFGPHPRQGKHKAAAVEAYKSFLASGPAPIPVNPCYSKPSKNWPFWGCGKIRPI